LNYAFEFVIGVGYMGFVRVETGKNYIHFNHFNSDNVVGKDAMMTKCRKGHAEGGMWAKNRRKCKPSGLTPPTLRSRNSGLVLR
jgi:hypothetical protein